MQLIIVFSSSDICLKIVNFISVLKPNSEVDMH